MITNLCWITILNNKIAINKSLRIYFPACKNISFTHSEPSSLFVDRSMTTCSDFPEFCRQTRRLFANVTMDVVDEQCRRVLSFVIDKQNVHATRKVLRSKTIWSEKKNEQYRFVWETDFLVDEIVWIRVGINLE